jgi:hypothetical protein
MREAGVLIRDEGSPGEVPEPGFVVVNTRGQYVKAWDRASVSNWTTEIREALVMSEADAVERLELNRKWRDLAKSDKRISPAPKPSLF